MYFIGYRNAEWILEALQCLAVTSQRSSSVYLLYQGAAAVALPFVMA